MPRQRESYVARLILRSDQVTEQSLRRDRPSRGRHHTLARGQGGRPLGGAGADPAGGTPSGGLVTPPLCPNPRVRDTLLTRVHENRGRFTSALKKTDYGQWACDEERDRWGGGEGFSPELRGYLPNGSGSGFRSNLFDAVRLG